MKEVYDFRMSKYQEWMDNLEALIGKVMANTQYTAKEFKIIKDTFTSLCRDLEKEGTKSWLDMMLDKLSSPHEGTEENLSTRDKNLKAQEKKKLEAMVERHDGLVGPTMEAQSKVQHYSECYAFGDDIHPVIKVLNEQKYLSIKEIHPHNMDMCEEQIEKQEKVLRTIENQAPIYHELMRRGEKLRSSPNAPQFLEKEMKRLEEMWIDTSEKAKIRLDLLQNSFKDWDVYTAKKAEILAPLDQLEEQYKTYRKVYDPKKGADWLERKKKKATDLKRLITDTYTVLKHSFANILALAGEDKKEFMEKEVKDIDERLVIVEKVDKTLDDLTKFNERLTKTVNQLAELRAWMIPTKEKLEFVTTTQELSPEDRVKEILDIQLQVKDRTPKIEPLGIEVHALLDAPEEETTQTSETALKHIADYEDIRDTVNELSIRIEVETGSITQDQKYYAEYLYGVKTFRPWMEEAETVAKAPLAKPASLEDAKKLLETVQEFDTICAESKGKLDAAVESRSKMEKISKADNEVQNLANRYNTVKKTSSDRVNKVKELCSVWNDLQLKTDKLANVIAEIPTQVKPDVAMLESIFKEFRAVNDKKLQLLAAI